LKRWGVEEGFEAKRKKRNYVKGPNGKNVRKGTIPIARKRKKHLNVLNDQDGNPKGHDLKKQTS